MEKIKPAKSLSSISSLKFQKKNDYKKFLNFIKLETEELKKIGAPREDKVKNILKVGGIGLLGFGLFNLFGKKGEGDEGKIGNKGKSDDFQTPFGIGRQTDAEFIKGKSSIEPYDFTKINKKKFSPFKSNKVNLSKSDPLYGTGNKGRTVNKKFINTENVRNTRGTEQQRAVNEFNAGNQNQRNVRTATIDDIGKTKGTKRQRVAKFGVDGGNKPGEVFMDMDGSFKTNYDDLSQQAKDINDKINRIENTLNDPNRKLTPRKERRLINDLNRLMGKMKGTIKPNILEKFMNFYNKGRNVRFPDENNAKLIDLFLDDLKQMTHSDKAFKTATTNIGTLRPFKAFTPNMLKTGPTPLTRQVIERPFRSLFRAGASGLKFLKNNPIVNGLLKSKVTKTGLFLIDAAFVGQEFYDLFLRPGDNVYTTLHDLYVSINNAYFHNDPERLKYFITESKGSGKLLPFGLGPGFTNEQIRRKEIERNLKIKRLKEAAAGVEGGGGDGGNNVVIVPFENKKQSAASNSGMIPFIEDTDSNIVIPTFEPLNIGDNILLQKLNQ